VVGLALHRFAIEAARGASAVTLIMITIGASIFLRGAAQVGFDKRFHGLPHLLGSDPIAFAGATILPQSLVVLAGGAVIVVVLWAFLERTLLGKAVLATAANRMAAQLVGIDTRRIVGFSFGVSAAIGAVAGILVAPITLTSYDVGTLLALKGFAAAMLGGIGSALGAVIGGLILGLLEAFGAGLVSSQYKDAFAFLVILGVLFAMPQGLLGRAKVERV
jgi:branched-chain amino acid transport system permease protein